ncbi:MAG: polysaccharide biosynthesis C-terminal domain-containing protein [Thermoplasmata archaeon]
MDLSAGTDRISTGVTYQYISTIVVLFEGFLFYLFLVHFFSTEIVGAIALLSAIMALFSIIFSLGLGTGVQHFISYYLGKKDPDAVRQIVKKMSLISVLIGMLAFTVTWVTAPEFAILFFHSYKYTIFVQLLSIVLIAQVINSVIYSMLLGLQNFKANAIRSIISSTLAYGSIIPLLLVYYNPLMILIGWNIGYFAGTILTFIFLAGKMKGLNAKQIERVQLKPIFYYSIPIFISSIIGYGATYIDRFTVSYFLSLSEMGIYNFSLLIVSALSSIINPFPYILLPKLSEYYGKKEYDTMKLLGSKAIEVMMAVYLPLALLVAAISPSILLFIANKAYLPGYVPIIIILVTNSIFISSNVLSVTLQAIRKTRIFLLSSSLALLSNLILSIILIPRYGIDGAGIAFSSIFIMGFAVVFYYAKKYDTVTFEKLKLAKIFLSGFLMFGIMFLVQQHFGYSILRLIAYIIVGLAIYMVLIRTTKTFKDADLDLFLTLLSDKYIRLKRLIRKILV